MASPCPRCGFREEFLAKSLKLGCPLCYRTFSAQIETILPRLHTGLWHPGKIPCRHPDGAVVR